MRILRACATIAMLGAMSGCGSSGGNGGGMALDDFINQYLAAQCALFVRCHTFSDQAFCLSALGPNSLRRGASISAVVNVGKASYDGVAAGACLTALSDTACADLMSPFSAQVVCPQAFTGTVTDGSPCITDQECLAGSFCALTTGVGAAACDRTCVRGGTLCSNDAQCTNGQVCDTTMPTSTSNGTCVTPTAAGAATQPCGTKYRCQPGLYCSLSGQPPTCVVPAQSGEACVGLNNLSCADGLICVPTNDGTTAATCMAPAARGQACQFLDQCGGLFSSIVCVQNVCVDDPTSGQPCAGTDIEGCNLTSSYCQTSQASGSLTCTPFSAAGGACNPIGGHECGIFSGAVCQFDAPPSLTGICVDPTVCPP
jgi:hypothetical protein